MILTVLPQAGSAQTIDYPKREFRGVWMATVNNIDWPSRQNLTPSQQRNEFVQLLEQHQETGFNAIFVQVRGAGDAIYPTQHAPWSVALTGEQGKAPSPYYDPLAFMVEEVHKRGMELHAWLNPFRVVTNVERSQLSAHHISHTHPDWVLRYGNMMMLNPGLPQVREHLLEVIKDLLKRYDIDGLHFDDYFYPYPQRGVVLADHRTFQIYGKGFRYKDDWRRYNIDELIRQVHELVLDIKPMVKFGVSPFGVWKNDTESAFGSATRSGNTCYSHLFADVRKWLQEGWLDYVAPQLYQTTQHAKIPYEPLLRWWRENTFGRHLYIGQAAYRAGTNDSKGWDDRAELGRQIRHNRHYRAEGSMMYNSSSLIANRYHITDTLRQRMYYIPALPPLMPWIDDVPPNAPVDLRVVKRGRKVALEWKTPQPASDGDLPAYYVVYSTTKSVMPDINNPRDIIALVPATHNRFVDVEAVDVNTFNYVMTAVDRLHNESKPCLPFMEDKGGKQERDGYFFNISEYVIGLNSKLVPGVVGSDK